MKSALFSGKPMNALDLGRNISAFYVGSLTVLLRCYVLSTSSYSFTFTPMLFVLTRSYSCKFGNFREGFIFMILRGCEVTWNNGEITLSLIGLGTGISCPSREFLTWQVCHLTKYIRENKILSKITEFTVLIFTFIYCKQTVLFALNFAYTVK